MLTRLLIASAFALGIAGSAQAACSVPAINDNDTVMKFGTSVSSESRGVMGTKGPLNARTAGTVYYDHAAGQLKLCNGSDWVNVIGGTAPPPEPANALKPGEYWQTILNGTVNGEHYSPGPGIVQHGFYKLRVDFSRTNARCSVYFKDGTNWFNAVRHDDSESSKGGGQVTWHVNGGQGAQNNRYRFMVEMIYGPDRAADNRKWNKHRIWMYSSTPFANDGNWDDDGNYLLRWNGQMKISLDSCRARVTMKRLK